MIKFIRLAVFSLLLGVIGVVYGASGSLTIKADVAQSTQNISQTYIGGIIVGSILIILSAIFFILAIHKSK